MKIAVCPGSFDPVTKGHLDIITRAAKLFDRVIVLVSVNPAKCCSFTLEERVSMIRRCTVGIEQVTVDTFSGLLADYVDKVGACAIVKGLRAVSDFEYEFQQALANKKLNSHAETIFLTTDSEYMFLSSSFVKQMASFGGDITDFVPKEIVGEITSRLVIKDK
jgi:pantetheine-phosphate adenylyltransferase